MSLTHRARYRRPRRHRRHVRRGQRRRPRRRCCRRRRRLGARAGDPIAVTRAGGVAAVAPAYSSYFLYAFVSASSTGPSISADLLEKVE